MATGVSDITALEVKRVLESLRRAQAFKNSPLLQMEALLERLRCEGIQANPNSLEWALGTWLVEIVSENLSRLRATTGIETGSIASDSSRAERGRMARDFQQDNADLEAWSYLFYRYAAGLGLQQREIASLARPEYDADSGRRHLLRRAARGYALLARQLQAAEHAARRPELMPSSTLPAPMAAFIGRDREQAALRSALLEARLVTLWGPGGIGKTRLALEVASGMIGRFTEGIGWIELAAIARPEQIEALVEGAGGAPNTGLAPPGHEPGTGTRLLVMDNCEHLLPGVAGWLRRYLEAHPQHRILATSRIVLGLAGERVIAIPPLGLPPIAPDGSLVAGIESDAVRLFLARADAVGAGSLAPARLESIMRLCHQLEGIPLAIELAAGRAQSIAPESILERLHLRLDLAAPQGEAAEGRHRTMRATLDWSHDLLDPVAARLLRRLAVFRGGWTLDGAEQVCVDATLEKPSIARSMSTLAEASFIRIDPGTGPARYQMLETIRAYAWELLTAAGEADALQDRHLEWAMATAQAADPAEKRDALVAADAILAAEHDNLRAALAFSLASSRRHAAGLRLATVLVRYWRRCGRLQEARAWLMNLLEQGASAAPPEIQARALFDAGEITHVLGDLAGARRLYTASLAFEESLDERVAAALLARLADVAAAEGELPAARSLIDRAISCQRQVPDRSQLLRLLIQSADLALRMGDGAALGTVLDEAQGLASDLSMPELQGLVLRMRADGQWASGAFREACAGYEACAELYRRLGDRLRLAESLYGSGACYQILGNFNRAQQRLEESLRLSRTVHDHRLEAAARRQLALLHLADGRLLMARQHTEQALARVDSRDTPGLAVEIMELMAVVESHPDPHRAVLLFSVAAARRFDRGIQASPGDAEACERHLEALRVRLGEPVFRQAWAEGQGLSWEDAVLLASGSDLVAA